MEAVRVRNEGPCALRGGSGVRFRLALYAGVSMIALAAFAAPDIAEAACSGADQTISSAVAGPILSTGGGISIQSGGSIAGGPTGILASGCSISALTNQGSVSGGAAPPERRAASPC